MDQVENQVGHQGVEGKENLQSGQEPDVTQEEGMQRKSTASTTKSDDTLRSLLSGGIQLVDRNRDGMFDRGEAGKAYSIAKQRLVAAAEQLMQNAPMIAVLLAATGSNTGSVRGNPASTSAEAGAMDDDGARTNDPYSYYDSGSSTRNFTANDGDVPGSVDAGRKSRRRRREEQEQRKSRFTTRERKLTAREL